MNSYFIMYFSCCLFLPPLLYKLNSNCRPDLEAIWDAVVSGRSLYDAQQPLVIDTENFPSRDAVISLEQFARFWYVTN